MKRFLLSAVALMALAIVSLPAAQAGTLEDQFDATCKITAGRSVGTGAVYAVTPTYAALLTNAHIVSDVKLVSCEFWSRGHQSGKLPGQVFLADPAIDAAVVLVPTQAFAGRTPKALPFAEANPPIGALIRSVGCANGTWLTGWQGHVTRYEGGQVYFLPPPANGRSGSAICNESGKIVGLLRIRTGREGEYQEGGAVDLRTLLSKLNPAAKIAWNNFQPDEQLAAYVAGCPGGNCPTPESEDGFGLRKPLFPLRPTPAAPISPVWPTLPQPTPTPAPTDLSPIIGAINGLQETMREQRQTIPPLPQSSGPDPQTLQALNQHGQAIDALGNHQKVLAGQVDQLGKGQAELTSNLDKLSKATGQIAETIAPLSKLHAKLEADAEAGGIKGKIAQKLLDAGEGDGSLRKVLITAGIVLGIVALLAIAVLHTMRTGQGPMHDILDKLAAKNPDNALIQSLHSKIEAVDARLAGAGKIVPNLATAGLAAATGGVPVAPGMAAADVLRLIEARLAPAPGQATSSNPPAVVNVNAGQPSAAAPSA